MTVLLIFAVPDRLRSLFHALHPTAVTLAPADCEAEMDKCTEGIVLREAYHVWNTFQSHVQGMVSQNVKEAVIAACLAPTATPHLVHFIRAVQAMQQQLLQPKRRQWFTCWQLSTLLAHSDGWPRQGVQRPGILGSPGRGFASGAWTNQQY